MKQKKDLKREVEDLKKLREIEAMIKRGDIENAFVSNATKDSETVSEAAADEILNRLDSENVNTKDIDRIISLTTNKSGVVVKRQQKKAMPRKAKGKKAATKPARKTLKAPQKKMQNRKIARVKPKATASKKKGKHSKPVKRR